MGGPYVPVRVMVQIADRPNQKVDTYTAAFPIEIAVRAGVISKLDHFPNVNQEVEFVMHWDCLVNDKPVHPMRRLDLSRRSVIRFVPAAKRETVHEGDDEAEVRIGRLPGGSMQTLKVPATITLIELAYKAGFIPSEAEEDSVRFLRRQDCRVNGKEVNPFRSLSLSKVGITTIIFTSAIQ